MTSPLVSMAPRAKIGKDVTIQLFAYVEDNVEIGDNCITTSYVNVLNGTRPGKCNEIRQHAILGAGPQDFHYKGEESSLIIGDNNHIRENVVISRATFGGNTAKTDSGSFLVGRVHVCHDVQIGDSRVAGIGTTVAGEYTLGDCVILSRGVTSRQYCHVGQQTLVQNGHRTSKDVPPYAIMAGNPVKYHGVSAVALQQHKNTSERVLRHIADAYRLIYQDNFSLQDAA